MSRKFIKADQDYLSHLTVDTLEDGTVAISHYNSFENIRQDKPPYCVLEIDGNGGAMLFAKELKQPIAIPNGIIFDLMNLLAVYQKAEESGSEVYELK